jgi:hypothetical protein
MQVADGIMKNLSQFPEEDMGVYLKEIADVIIGVDHKLAHTQAHIQLASRGADKAAAQQLNQWSVATSKINKMQDRIEQMLNDAQKKRIEESRARNGADPKVQHLKEMYALEEEHEAQMLAYDLQKSQSKGEQLRNNSAANHQLKQNLEVVRAQHQMTLDTLVATARAKQDQIKTEAKLNETQSKKAKNLNGSRKN